MPPDSACSDPGHFLVVVQIMEQYLVTAVIDWGLNLPPENLSCASPFCLRVIIHSHSVLFSVGKNKLCLRCFETRNSFANFAGTVVLNLNPSVDNFIGQIGFDL